MTGGAASITVLIGATGTGKSETVKRWLRDNKPARLIAYDPQNDYGEFALRTNRLSVIERDSRNKTFALALSPSDDLEFAQRQFNELCNIAYDTGNCVFIVDELADVTTAGWSPAGWSRVVRKGRHRAMVVIAASGRPADIDKRVLGMATRIICRRLNDDPSVRTMAAVLQVQPAELIALTGYSAIERDMTTGEKFAIKG